MSTVSASLHRIQGYLSPAVPQISRCRQPAVHHVPSACRLSVHHQLADHPHWRGRRDEEQGHDALLCPCNKPKRFLSVTRCRDHLSSGEKRAGCADLVTLPSRTFWSV